MFTWICPQCGKEVPPHESDCPYCKEREQHAARPAPPPPPAAAPPPPPQQPWLQPPQAPPPSWQAPQQPPWPQPPPGYQAPPPGYQALRTTVRRRRPRQPNGLYEIDDRQGLPGWLVTLLVAAVIVGVGAAGYYYGLPALRGGAAAGQRSPFEEVPVAGRTATGSHLAKYIEVTGFRISEDANKRTQIQFLVVNHSPADIGNLAGKVRLRTIQSKPDDPPISEFEFKTTRLGPYESVEFKTLIRTSLRAYELPDWQFLTADVEITSPRDL